MSSLGVVSWGSGCAKVELNFLISNSEKMIMALVLIDVDFKNKIIWYLHENSSYFDTEIEKFPISSSLYFNFSIQDSAPGVYARVTNQLTWIKSKMAGSTCPSA